MAETRILRPLNYGDLLDETFDLYKKNFLLFTGITALLLLPITLAIYATGGEYASVLASVALLPVTFFTMAATTWAVSQRYLGSKATILTSYKAVLSRLLGLIVTLLIAYLLVIAGFFLLIIPGIIFSFWIVFASQVVILEAKAGRQAIGRSRRLAAGQWGRIFILGLLTGLLVFIGQMILTAPVEALGFVMTGSPSSAASGVLGLLYGLASGLASAVISPIQIVAFVLLYYDIRVRKEGFDLEMLATNLGEPAPPAAPQETKPV